MAEEIKKSEYNTEQIEVLETIYGYSDTANYSKEDLALARIMFDKPEKFALLRKILQVMTPNERGLSIPNPKALVDADIKDLHGYAIATAVNNLADEKVRQTLNAFYRLMRATIVADKKAEYDAENKEEFKEKQNSEDFIEKQKEETEKFPEHL